MARTPLTKEILPSKFPSLPLAVDVADIAFEAADIVNQNEFQSSGDDLIIAWNKDAAAQTVTINSAAHPQTKRSGDITAYSIGIGEIAMFRVGGDGWDQPGGIIHLEASVATVFFAVIPMPK